MENLGTGWSEIAAVRGTETRNDDWVEGDSSTTPGMTDDGEIGWRPARTLLAGLPTRRVLWEGEGVGAVMMVK